ncbi:MAG TPA: RNA polymerase factor sigma-54 [Steroidobacteraceae bacterium]|nr:RNA polymerase factor sigma-54 [Steroidobacteraceae bacterium]
MLKPALLLKLGQQLTMTPQLQQAIKLLQLPVLELQAQVQEALETNVMLEQEEDETIDLASLEQSAPAGESETDGAETEVGGESDDGAAGEEVVVEMEDPWAESSTPSGDGARSDDDDRPLEFTDERGNDLHQHLIWQLEISPLDPRQLWIGEAIVDSLNDDGYLVESCAEIAHSLSADLPVAEEDVEAVLAFVQTLDPSGVGARTLSECLTLQLAQLDAGTPGRALALSIARDHLQAVADRDLGALRRALGVDEDALQGALALVRACHPRPGSAFEGAQPEYVVPDVFVRRTDQGWSVELNAGSVPRLKVNQGYAGLVARSADYASLRAQLQEARWLIRSLEIRNETLLKVARSIVQRQSAFLERGDEAMQPMILRDVAEAVGMHESTISRVTTGKYMHTPRGIFEFRYFFSSHVSGTDGEDVSSVAIRARIRKLIGDEPPDKPLSDAQLATILAGEGVKVARRTVAKYREALGLASSSERRQVAARAQ